MPKIGTVGDNYVDALGAAVQRLLPSRAGAAARRGPDPSTSVDDFELGTLGWVHWHNNQRLHGYPDDQPPAAFTNTFYAAQRTDQDLVRPNSPSLHQL